MVFCVRVLILVLQMCNLNYNNQYLVLMNPSFNNRYGAVVCALSLLDTVSSIVVLHTPLDIID